jgi:hypothetical protein
MHSLDGTIFIGDGNDETISFFLLKEGLPTGTHLAGALLPLTHFTSFVWTDTTYDDREVDDQFQRCVYGSWTRGGLREGGRLHNNHRA